MSDWFCIKNISLFDSPLLAIYPERIKQNIHLAIDMVKGDKSRLRPHVKTNKMAEVCTLMLQSGITKFKCATISEAEMLGMIKAPDALLAYQPVGPKINRLIALIKAYPQTRFSCLVDNENSARALNEAAIANDIRLAVFIDLNVGMNRTGLIPERAVPLAREINNLPFLFLAGLHAYDGHIRDIDIESRKKKTIPVLDTLLSLQIELSSFVSHPIILIAGGTPTFPAYVEYGQIECSPGTFVFSDWGYHHSLPDEPFLFAALIITRIVSIIDKQTICVDLGHKSVAAENPLPRVHFLNATDVVAVSQSEEHLVLKHPSDYHYKIGDVLYGVPVHICPTVALYDKACVVENENIVNEWKVIARDRSITV